jgi:AcrR family transcriptional regulator
MGQARKRHRRLRRSREDIRERLLDAALGSSERRGLTALQRAIAESIDAHQPQIHYHFESKEALWRAAVDHLFAELDRAMERLDFGADPARPTAVDTLADGFADLIRRFVRFAAARPELNQIMVHEATAKSERLRWMTNRHVRPLYDAVRVLWRRLREAGIAAPIDEAVFHYVLVGAASLPYVNASEARLLTRAEPTDRSWVERHADGLVATFLPNRS